MTEENIINLIGATINNLFEYIQKEGLGKIDNVYNGKTMIPNRLPHRNRIVVKCFMKNNVQLVPAYLHDNKIAPKIFVQKDGKDVSILLIGSIKELPSEKWNILDANTKETIKEKCKKEEVCKYLKNL